ncbi:GNAT family N-acetyltransferase [Achromobacter xylosoxidans]|uniref:GNAT family N-acetyltransferase n=1 Tax=Alcaligenes xylosoxydans xylosoxydans TaxID=85698 RepID=UPI000B491354|nr:GNAT family N-acetyltransferase [Achromobacter xylosoxidans]
MPDWICKPHQELTVTEIYAILRLRTEVFVIEQNCVFQDMDGKDLIGQTSHLMAWQDGKLAAYCRILDPSLKDGQIEIGRVITAPWTRGQGLGHELIRHAMQEVRLRWPGRAMYLGAQARLRNYYGGHGFVQVTEEYIEDGIPHVGMRLDEAA